jgi:endogenous inhibitor of DNA gyrase (YacG/DUF329 family)
MVSKVTCPKCKEEFYSEKVLFINIEEDFYGRDLLEFECPKCEKNVKSLVISKSH